MLLLYPTKLKVVAISATILVVGGIAGTITYRLERSHLRHDLIHDAVFAAASFDRESLQHLTGTPADVASATYADVKRKLQLLKAADPEIRYVYLLRARDRSGPVVFLGDSLPLGAKDESQPGDAFAEATRSRGLQEMLRTGGPAIDGPLHDNVGTWATGFVRIDSTAAKAPASDILGIDVAADNWSGNLWVAAARGAFYAWILLGLPFVAVLVTRRQGEQREAIRNLSEAVDQSHSAIMILDLDHRIEYVNRGLCQQIGYSRRELIGRHWREFLVANSADATVTDLIATVQSGRAWEGEWQNQRKDGTTYPVHGMITPVHHRDGALSCFVAIFDDVTELKRKEAELRDARDLAEAGDRAKGQFLATMSHEVRTPLNGIVGFTSLLLETPLSAEQREYVQTIRASGEALIHLTGDILDFARIESGKLKLDPIACDPRECIEEALDLHATKAAEKNIELLHRASDNVPAAVVVDGGRLRQVLVNLVGNAVKFTERGEVEVRVRAIEADAGAPAAPTGSVRPNPPCALEFSIRDTGIGIPPEQHSRLFKPFSQIDESSTRRYGGAGLGLAICKNLVHLMGGEISVASEAGRGTTFTFTIRATVAAPRPPERQLEGLQIGLAVAPGSLRREIVELLGSWGAEVVERDTAAELVGQQWDVAFVEVSETIAQSLAGTSGAAATLPPEKTLALVPISLSSELRAALRTHFRLLVNRPIHHGPLFALLSGSRPTTHPATGPSTQFGFRVLIVEDNQVNQRLLQRVLNSLGCTWKVVGNGREAIDELAQHARDYNVVLLDLHMPEMDGLSALERIRRGEAGPDAQTLWIVALTADVRPEQRARGFAAGLNDYLTKPLRLPDLETALRRYRAERLARKT